MYGELQGCYFGSTIYNGHLAHHLPLWSDILRSTPEIESKLPNALISAASYIVLLLFSFFRITLSGVYHASNFLIWAYSKLNRLRSRIALSCSISFFFGSNNSLSAQGYNCFSCTINSLVINVKMKRGTKNLATGTVPSS